MMAVIGLEVLAATAAMAHATSLRVAEPEFVVAAFRMARGATHDAYAAALGGQTPNVLRPVNGQRAANGAEPHDPFGATAPAFIVCKAPMCAQMALAARTSAPGASKTLTLLLSTTGSQDSALPPLLATGVAKIRYPSAETRGVVVDQNGGIQ